MAGDEAWVRVDDGAKAENERLRRAAGDVFLFRRAGAGMDFTFVGRVWFAREERDGEGRSLVFEVRQAPAAAP